MNVVICVDDTDSLDKKISTGKIADYIKQAIEDNKIGICESITRHQLLLHPDIPYTSHNSSMCMVAEIKEGKEIEIIKLAADIIEGNMADEADPGFCLCITHRLKPEDLHKLITFGQLAQKEVLSKETAYKLAKDLDIHLSEHGGTGQGVIGALAGVGLRLSGNDGRFKGQLKIKSSREDGLVTVSEICAQTGSAEVRDVEGNILQKEQQVELGEYAKAVLYQHRKVVVVASKEEGGYTTCTKEQLEGAENGIF